MPDSFPIILHEAKEFADDVIYLQGHAYVNCSIENCHVIYRPGSTPAILKGCSIGHCTWEINAVLTTRRDAESLIAFLDFVRGSLPGDDPTSSVKVDLEGPSEE